MNKKREVNEYFGSYVFKNKKTPKKSKMKRKDKKNKQYQYYHKRTLSKNKKKISNFKKVNKIRFSTGSNMLSSNFMNSQNGLVKKLRIKNYSKKELVKKKKKKRTAIKS